MRRFLVTSMLGLLLGTSPAFAAEADTVVAPVAPVLSLSAASLAEARLPVVTTPRRVQGAARPSLLPALYVGSAVLQGYDAYSTLTALKGGATEANPMMKAVTKSPAAFVAVKAGVTAASILAAEHLWKNHNRVGAIVTMIASNSFMAYVAAHNARVIGRLQ